MASKLKGRKRCQIKGCMKLARREGFCIPHAEAQEPVESVQRLTVAEAEQWGRLYAEMQMALQKARLIQHSKEDLAREYQKRIDVLERQREEAVADAQSINQRYDQLTDEICDKYGTDRKCTIIDVESRVIREESTTDKPG